MHILRRENNKNTPSAALDQNKDVCTFIFAQHAQHTWCIDPVSLRAYTSNILCYGPAAPVALIHQIFQLFTVLFAINLCYTFTTVAVHILNITSKAFNLELSYSLSQNIYTYLLSMCSCLTTYRIL